MNRSLSAGVAEALSSRALTALLLALWLVHIWGSIWYLAPGPDDGGFIAEALALQHRGSLGLIYINDFADVYINLPAYAFSQAAFLLATDLVGIPLNIYTYRFFNLIVLTLVVVLGAALIRMVAVPESGGPRARVNLFLAVLGVSPFVVDVAFQRPEGLGILATVIALAAYARAAAGGRAYYWLCGLMLGFAAITHPTFVVTSAIVAATALWFRIAARDTAGAACAAAAGAVGPLATLAWLWSGWPQSWEMLSTHIAQRAPDEGRIGSGLTSIVTYAMFGYGNDDSLAIRAYFAVLFSVLLLLGLITVVILAWRARRPPVDQSRGLILAFFFGALFNAAIAGARIQVYTVLGFAAVLAAVTMLPAIRRVARP